jgi:hypothetical protein
MTILTIVGIGTKQRYSPDSAIQHLEYPSAGRDASWSGHPDVRSSPRIAFNNGPVPFFLEFSR